MSAFIRREVSLAMFGKEALRLFDAYEQVKTAKLDSLRQDIAKGLNDAADGRAEKIDFASLKQQI